MANPPEPNRKIDWELTPSAFQRLLNWLDPDPESAGQRYIEIRHRLVSYFNRKNCSSGQELADETLNRVARRLEQEGEITGSTPSQFCFNIARYIFLESLRRRQHQDTLHENLVPPYEFAKKDQLEQQLSQCLDHCLKKLSDEDRDIILGYYQGERRKRIENRKAMAEILHLSLNALSIRACRIRVKLESCIRTCMKR
jgi:DNA-directed RNA polymerase specialized sigma24 family protein